MEPVYQEAMELEVTMRQLPFVSQPTLQILYKEHTLKKGIFLISFSMKQIIVEIKAWIS